MTEADLLILTRRLRRRLPDEYSRRMFDGSWRAFNDDANPLRLTFFSLGMREMVGHIFHLLAPDDNVSACSWFFKEHDTITRQQRAKYIVQGGLSDSFLQSIHVDMATLYASVSPMIKTLSKHVHVREATSEPDQPTIMAVVSDTLTFLGELFQAIRSCRKKVTDALEETIHEETIMALISENLDYIDVLSSTHSVETVDVSSVVIISIDEEIVRFRVRGEIGVDFHWGSSHDGIDGDETFPFEATMWSSVDDLQSFQDIEVTVDDSSWQKTFEPDIEC